MGNPLPERLWKCEAGECTQQTTPADDQFRTYEECKLQCPALTGCSLCPNTKGVIWKMEGVAFCDTVCWYNAYTNKFYRWYNPPLLNGTYYIPHYTTYQKLGVTYCAYRWDYHPPRTLDAAIWVPPYQCSGLPAAAAHYPIIRFEAVLSSQFTPHRWVAVSVSGVPEPGTMRLWFFLKNSPSGAACNNSVIVPNTATCAGWLTSSGPDGPTAGVSCSRLAQGTVTLSLLE